MHKSKDTSFFEMNKKGKTAISGYHTNAHLKMKSLKLKLKRLKDILGEY